MSNTKAVTKSWNSTLRCRNSWIGFADACVVGWVKHGSRTHRHPALSRLDAVMDTQRIRRTLRISASRSSVLQDRHIAEPCEHNRYRQNTLAIVRRTHRRGTRTAKYRDGAGARSRGGGARHHHGRLQRSGAQNRRPAESELTIAARVPTAPHPPGSQCGHPPFPRYGLVRRRDKPDMW